MSGASFHRGASEQAVGTPDDFLAALGVRFDFDLAATDENRIAPLYYGPGSLAGEDALKAHWDQGFMWCNPPYGNLALWVAKACTVEAPNALTMLIPASVGANWWRDYVHGKANVEFLNGRLTFKGHCTPYPKDLALLHYPFDPGTVAYDVWNWRNACA